MPVPDTTCAQHAVCVPRCASTPSTRPSSPQAPLITRCASGALPRGSACTATTLVRGCPSLLSPYSPQAPAIRCPCKLHCQVLPPHSPITAHAPPMRLPFTMLPCLACSSRVCLLIKQPPPCHYLSPYSSTSLLQLETPTLCICLSVKVPACLVSACFAWAILPPCHLALWTRGLAPSVGVCPRAPHCLPGFQGRWLPARHCIRAQGARLADLAQHEVS